MSLIRAILGFIMALALTGFAVSNRQDTTLIYSPLHDPLEVPLYLIALLFMAAGFILGAMAVWFNGAKTRKLKRQQRKTIKTLEKELSEIKKTQLESEKQPPSEFFPALPEQQNSSIKQG
ncbi:MAG: LapA family protein [Pseudomonadota bacterium]